MNNPFTENVLNNQNQFSTVIDSFKDLSYIELISESISKHSIKKIHYK